MSDDDIIEYEDEEDEGSFDEESLEEAREDDEIDDFEEGFLQGVKEADKPRKKKKH